MYLNHNIYVMSDQNLQVISIYLNILALALLKQININIII